MKVGLEGASTYSNGYVMTEFDEAMAFVDECAAVAWDRDMPNLVLHESGDNTFPILRFSLRYTTCHAFTGPCGSVVAIWNKKEKSWKSTSTIEITDNP